jgi:subtilase family serine protease
MFATAGFVKRAFVAAAPLVFVCASWPAAAQTATLATSIPAIVSRHAAAYVGAPSPTAEMDLVISLPLRNTAALDAFLADIYSPKSRNYRHYLSVAQFTERFGPTASDYNAAVQFFAAQGLTIQSQTANRYIIDVGGTVADIERVFHVTMGLYRHPTENRNFLSPDRAPALDLAVPIQQVLGLDDFVRPYAKYIHNSAVESRNAGGSGPNGNLTGSDMRTAYYPTGSLTGQGQSVGLMELQGYNINDVNRFFSRGYGPSNSVPVIAVKTDKEPLKCPAATCDDTEQVLDIEYTISIAPELASVRVYVGSSAEDVLNKMATDNISKVLSTSWGWNENFATDDGLFQEFAAQGQTNLTASGDYSSLAASGPWPEEDANIVAVGGTDVRTATPGGAWSVEAGWNSSAGGPSLDTSIGIESYQSRFINASNGGSTTLRNVPDVAANAEEDMVICADNTCKGGWGGTSFASPMWAGFIALANQQAVSSGKPVLGFINPAIYGLARGSGYKSIFHDVRKGTSGDYSCTYSYDLVTGLGSPQGQALIDALTPY